MVQRDNILPFDGDQRFASNINLKQEEYEGVKSCRKVTAWILPRLLGGMFEKLDDVLFDLSNKKDSGNLQIACFHAMRELRREQENLQEGFQRRILHGFDRFWKTGKPDAETAEGGHKEGEELLLVADDELEDTLAITSMTAKSENRYSRELYAIEQRFGALARGLVVDSKNNPLDPVRICESFQRALEPLELELSAKLVVYKLFDREVMAGLGKLYNSVNDVLAQAGVLPKLTPKVKPNAGAPVVGGSSGAAVGGQAQASTQADYSDDVLATGDSVAVDREFFANLQGLLNQRRSYVSPGNQAVVVDTGQIVAALSNLQQGDHLSSEAGLGVQDLRGLLQQELNIDQSVGSFASKERSDENMIDVISMLFEFILEDRNLPDTMKVLLARLQIPMVKVALLDKEFFYRQGHPARHLLNSLAQAALGWSDDGDRSAGSLYGMIDAIVSRVLLEFDQDVELFTELNEEFAEYLEAEQRTSSLAEERATQATRGKEQLALAKRQVGDEIAKRFEQYDGIPKAAVELLEHGWKDVLMLTALRQGVEGEEWTERITMLDQLLWSVTPKKSLDERRELLQIIPGLLKGLRVELTNISFDQHKMIRLFKELQACHMACLRGESIPGIDPKTLAATQSKQEESKAGITASSGSQQAKPAADQIKPAGDQIKTGTIADTSIYLRKAQEIPLGSWLELKGENDTSRRIKLAWKSGVSGNHLFVNNKGIKVLEVCLEKLADAMRTGKMVLLAGAETPLLDRALTSIADGLQNAEA